MITKTRETKVKNTCDQLIAPMFCCQEPAAFPVKRNDSPEYAIMCALHRTRFQRQYPNEDVIYHEWNLQLNQKFSEQAETFWQSQSVE